MAIDIGIEEQDRKAIAEGLSRLLAVNTGPGTGCTSFRRAERLWFSSLVATSVTRTGTSSWRWNSRANCR